MSVTHQIKNDFLTFTFTKCSYCQYITNPVCSVIHTWTFNNKCGKVVIYKVIAEALAKVTTYEISKDIYYAASISVGNRIFLFGGKTLFCFNELNYATKALDPLPPLLNQKSFFGICQDGSAIYNAGGSNSKKFLKSCEKYDITKNEWTSLPNLVNPRDKCSITPFNRSFLYIVGGYSNGLYKLNIERLNLVDCKIWEPIYVSNEDDFSRSRAGMMQINHNQILVFGGSCNTKCQDCFVIKVNGKSHTLSPANDMAEAASFMKTPMPAMSAYLLFAMDSEKKMQYFNVYTKKWAVFIDVDDEVLKK